MPRIDIAAQPVVHDSTYPEPWGSRMGRRSFQDLGDAAGLTQFGVVLAVLHPGATSSLRHWHSAEDEFVWIVEGELVLVQDAGETVLRAGDAAGFAAGDPDGHHLLNRSGAVARYLVAGTRMPDDVCRYSDVDLVFSTASGRFTRRDGTPVGEPAETPADERENP
jgi:uncharacterized cupin superfamily protein